MKGIDQRSPRYNFANVEMGKTYHFVVMQYPENGTVRYKIKVNNEKMMTKKNTHPEEYENVKVYAGNPQSHLKHFSSEFGKVENLKFDGERQCLLCSSNPHLGFP